MKAKWTGLGALALWGGMASAAWAAPTGPTEKLEAPLPSVTVLGTPRGTALRPDQRVSPEAMASASLSLALPVPRRGTREEAGRLGVEVTPSTLLPPPLPGPGPAMTQLQAMYGPLRLGRAELWDTRSWGPAWGSLRMGGLAGADWLRYGGQGEWRLADQGLASLALGQLRAEAPTAGSVGTWAQGGWSGALAPGLGLKLHAEGSRLQALNSGFATATGPWDSLRVSAQGRGQWAVEGGHELSAELTGQWRQWGTLQGPEGYLRLAERYAPNEQFEAEFGLGGGQWGFEPILDPSLRFSYRPSHQVVLRLGGRTRSLIPDALAQVRDRQAVAPNLALASERAEGEGELGLDWAPSPEWLLHAEAGGHRTHRMILWGSTPGDARWSPTNATGIQIGPKGEAEIAWRPHAHWQLSLGYAGRAAYPLNWAEHRGSLGLQGLMGPLKVQARMGLRAEQLTTAQLAGGGLAMGLVGAAELRWALLPQLEVVGSAQDWGQPLGAGPGLTPFGLLPTAGLGLALTF